MTRSVVMSWCFQSTGIAVDVRVENVAVFDSGTRQFARVTTERTTAAAGHVCAMTTQPFCPPL
jgi:hypothetical protein